MDSQPSIKIRIPEAEDFEQGAFCIPVPHNIVYSTIDVLQGLLALWKWEEGSAADQRLWAPLMTAAGQALAGLVAADAARRADSYARYMAEQWGRVQKTASGAQASARTVEQPPSQPEPEPAGQSGEDQQAPADHDEAGWDF